MSKKVLLVDDHKVIMDGIELYINSIEGYEVIDKAQTGDEALLKIKKLLPDIVLLDYQLPDYNGIDLIPQVLKLSKEIKIIILTSYEEPDLAIRAIKAGAKAYLTKQIDEKGLARVLNGMFEGNKTWLDPNITFNVISNINAYANKGSEESFNEEEKQLLRLVAKGKTNQQIAKELYLTEQTVKNYLLKMYKKFSLRNRSEAASLAIKHKVI